MKIRRMQEQDAAQAAEIDREVFSCPWSRQGFLDSLANPAALFLVAEEEAADCGGGGAIAGYIGMYLSMDEAEITNVAVKPEFCRRGIGNALIAAAKTRAQEAGVSRMVLEVRLSNCAAIRLYEKNGFCRIGIRRGFYEKPKEDAGIMIWEK